MTRFALDSNFMAYAEGVNDRQRQDIAARLIQSIAAEDLLVPIQAAGELMLVLIRKLRLDASEASARVSLWLDYATQDTSRAVFEGARELVSLHSLQVWDSIILAAAEAGGASILLSEDMQDGFSWRNVTIINPFVVRPAPLVGELLNRRIH